MSKGKSRASQDMGGRRQPGIMWGFLFLTPIVHGTPSGDREDGCATGQPQALGPLGLKVVALPGVALAHSSV
jgi:hypothetical protein